MKQNQTNAFEGALASLGLRYWEYDISSKRLYRSALVQNEVGYEAYKENVPESYVEEGIIHPDYAQEYIDLYYNLAKGIDGRLVFETLFGNNTWGWLDISYKVIFDEEGRPTKAVGIGGDVTKAKQKELENSLTQKDNELLTNVIRTAVAYEFNYLSFVNKDTGEFITYSTVFEEEAYRGEDFSSSFREKLKKINMLDYESISKLLEFDVICKELENNDSYFIPFTLKEEGKECKYKICRFYNVKGNRKYVLMTVRDVTDTSRESEIQKLALEEAREAAESANQAKTKFLSDISHDIRTPLNAIINLNDMVKTELYDEKQVLSDLDKISLSGEFLLGLINDILDLSTVESKVVNLTNSLYPYDEFRQYLDSVILPLGDQKNIKINFDMLSNADMIITDRTRFNQIFFNILSNGIKYNHVGGHVNISSKPLWKKNDKMYIEYIIEDDGIGMSEEFQKKLFEPFAREDATGMYSGTGLGMNITKSIIEKMGGDIYAESKKGVGTKFTIHLTLKIASEQQRKEYYQSKLDKEKNNKTSLDILGHGKHILIVEDHPLNQEILTRIIGKYGIITECVSNGKLAVDSFVNHMTNYYDAILMDIRMPVMDGLEATRRIRASEKSDAQSIPIIAMTGNAFQEDIEKAKQVGVSEYLTKPIEPMKLTCTLEAVFAGKYAL